FPVLAQSLSSEVQQPRAHDAAITPDFGDLGDIEVQFRFVLHDFKAFGEGLHHAILNAVVNHLDKVACSAGADMPPAQIRRGREGFKGRAQVSYGFIVAADHEAVTFGQPPDAAAGPHVDKMNV